MNYGKHWKSLWRGVCCERQVWVKCAQWCMSPQGCVNMNFNIQDLRCIRNTAHYIPNVCIIVQLTFVFVNSSIFSNTLSFNYSATSSQPPCWLKMSNHGTLWQNQLKWHLQAWWTSWVFHHVCRSNVNLAAWRYEPQANSLWNILSQASLSLGNA